MLTAGQYHTLRVNRVSDFGLYLIDDQENEVLLPNRWVLDDNKVGDELRVFVYHDSEDRLVATTETPAVVAGEAAYLKVVDKTQHGVFLDWGIPAKDLFLPNRNQLNRMEIGRSYVVYVYTDNITGRAVASSRLNGFIHNTELNLHPRQEVDILVAQRNDSGYRVIIDNAYWGMIYYNQIFRPVSIGDRLKAHVNRITEDNRVDLTLELHGYDQVKLSADRLLELLAQYGGRLPLNDDSSSEEVTRIAHMSKKVFKRSVGYLLKQDKVTFRGGFLEPKGEPKDESK